MKPSIVSKFQGSLEDVIIRNAQKQTLEVSQSTQKLLDHIWTILEKKAQDEGRNLWNGQSLRLDHFEEQDGKLYLDLSHIWFKDRYGLEAAYRSDECSTPSERSQGLAVGAVVKTSDDWYVFGLQSQTTMSSSQYAFLGGLADDLELNSGYGLYQEMLREVEEESGILATDIEFARLLGMFQNHVAGYIMLFDVQLTITRDEVYQRFQENSDVEHADLVFVTPEELSEFLKQMGSWKSLVLDLL